MILGSMAFLLMSSGASAGMGSAVPPERVIGSEPERRWVRLKPFPLSSALPRRVLHARSRSIRIRLRPFTVNALSSASF
jgi:DNA-binding transcriptional LysR family regulator